MLLSNRSLSQVYESEIIFPDSSKAKITNVDTVNHFIKYSRYYNGILSQYEEIKNFYKAGQENLVYERIYNGDSIKNSILENISWSGYIYYIFNTKYNKTLGKSDTLFIQKNFIITSSICFPGKYYSYSKISNILMHGTISVNNTNMRYWNFKNIVFAKPVIFNSSNITSVVLEKCIFKSEFIVSNCTFNYIGPPSPYGTPLVGSEYRSQFEGDIKIAGPNYSIDNNRSTEENIYDNIIEINLESCIFFKDVYIQDYFHNTLEYLSSDILFFINLNFSNAIFKGFLKLEDCGIINLNCSGTYFQNTNSKTFDINGSLTHYKIEKLQDIVDQLYKLISGEIKESRSADLLTRFNMLYSKFSFLKYYYTFHKDLSETSKYSMVLENCLLIKSLDFYSTTFKSNVKFTSSDFQRKIKFDKSSFLANLELSKVNFFDTLIFHADTVQNIEYGPTITKSIVVKYLDLGNSNFKPELFKTAYFTEATNLLLDSNTYISDLNISLEDLNRVNIVLYDPYQPFNDTTFKYNDALHSLEDAIQYVNTKKEVSSSLKNDVLDKLEYQKFLLNMKRKKDEKSVGYIWDAFTDLTVKRGYNGIERFLYISGSILFIFAIIYCLPRFKYDILVLTKKNNIKSKLDVEKEKFEYKKFLVEENYNCYNDLSKRKRFLRKISDFILDFTQTLWFSTKVFLSPKYHQEYFCLSKGLQIVIIVEYFAGTVMMLLFFAFIASKFAFIKALLG
jgi:hypothetical protein